MCRGAVIGSGRAPCRARGDRNAGTRRRLRDPDRHHDLARSSDAPRCGLGDRAGSDARSTRGTEHGRRRHIARSARRRALAARRAPDDGAARTLVDRAIDTQPDHPAHLALSRPGAARVVAILSRLTSADDRTALILVAALARMRFGPATVALFEALAMANPAARAAAASALVAADVPGAVQVVTALARSDPDSEVRRVCSAVLGWE